MYTRCLTCARPFEPNEALEHLPNGERVAYDPERGRLWLVCRGCRQWSLVPIEARWEALEELERKVKDRARLLSRTDNISLFRADGLEIVRVGRAGLTEEAWWRFGRELRDRREAAARLSLAGTVATGAFIFVGSWTGGMSLFGMWLLLRHAPDSVTKTARWLRFGRNAWVGERTCPQCGRSLHRMAYKDLAGLHLLPVADDGSVGLALRCPGCGHQPHGSRMALMGGTEGDDALQLTGTEGERTLRRALAYQHFGGASEKRIRSATRLIEEAGSPKDLARIVVGDGRRLLDLKRTGSIALEIAASDSAERRLLELELADLEAHWRQEEQLAGIIDGELTPLPPLEALRRRVGRPLGGP